MPAPTSSDLKLPVTSPPGIQCLFLASVDSALMDYCRCKHKHVFKNKNKILSRKMKTSTEYPIVQDVLKKIKKLVLQRKCILEMIGQSLEIRMRLKFYGFDFLHPHVQQFHPRENSMPS